MGIYESEITTNALPAGQYTGRKENEMEKYNGYEDEEWIKYWGLEDFDEYDPFEGEEN